MWRLPVFISIPLEEHSRLSTSELYFSNIKKYTCRLEV
jgi:hypothetical protein